MNPLRRLFGPWSRHRSTELSAEDELFAERLTEMLRNYVNTEIPDTAVPRFQTPVPAQPRRSPRPTRAAPPDGPPSRASPSGGRPSEALPPVGQPSQASSPSGQDSPSSRSRTTDVPRAPRLAIAPNISNLSSNLSRKIPRFPFSFPFPRRGARAVRLHLEVPHEDPH